MGAAMAEGRRVTTPSGIGSVVFAHKTTEGWESLLAGMIQGGWTITGSWPIATEMRERLNARDTASLATSVHLVCRPRPEDAPIGDWADVLRELPPRVGDWMERLQGEKVRGADLVFACIGPALEIYSRYSKVVDPQEREIPLGGDRRPKEPHSARIFGIRMGNRRPCGAPTGPWHSRSREARNGAAGALEEDARLLPFSSGRSKQLPWTTGTETVTAKSRRTKPIWMTARPKTTRRWPRKAEAQGLQPDL